MENISLVEEYFKKFVNDLSTWIPEGVLHVDLNMLQHFNLLHFHGPENHDPGLTRYFHIIESIEKITLINEQFVVWIIPEKSQEFPVTYTLIALNQAKGPKLEMVISHAGVYNTSHLVLRVLEKILIEIQENEELLSKINRSA